MRQIYEFYDEDGNMWFWDAKSNKTNCELVHDYIMVEDGIIYLCQDDGEVLLKTYLI